MNYFSEKLGFHTQIGVINQVGNREITQSFGFHTRCASSVAQFIKNESLTYVSALFATNFRKLKSDSRKESASTNEAQRGRITRQKMPVKRSAFCW